MSSPFRVKDFRAAWPEQVNEWFDHIADDKDYDYDIRQVLAVEGRLLIFYEMTPKVQHCTVVCPTCGHGPLPHYCRGCDNNE